MIHNAVIPAKAGTQLPTCAVFDAGPCFRRDNTLVEGYPK
jgi:hypothetical protein